MYKQSLVILALAFITIPAGAQTAAMYQPDDGTPPPFEVYALASGLGTVDASGTVVIQNPAPNQPLGFAPSGIASGARLGLVWRHENVGLMAEVGFHKYADRSGSISMAPVMLGIRRYSDEHFRTSFFGEGLAGVYRWSVNFGNTRFTTGKMILLAGGGMDIRLTQKVVWRVGEIQVGIAGARVSPLLTGGLSTGIAYRF